MTAMPPSPTARVARAPASRTAAPRSDGWAGSARVGRTAVHVGRAVTADGDMRNRLVAMGMPGRVGNPPGRVVGARWECPGRTSPRRDRRRAYAPGERDAPAATGSLAGAEAAGDPAARGPVR